MTGFAINYINNNGRSQFVNDLQNPLKLFIERDRSTAERIASKLNKGRVISLDADVNSMLINSI